MKLHKLLALLLTLAMVLSMVVGIVPASAEETAAVEELPTVTIPVDATTGTEADPSFYQCNFVEESQLADFDLYQSGTSKFIISDGVLKPDGTDGEQKAIFNKDVSTIKSVSVNIIPGASGNIYAGVYVGAKNPANTQDSIDSMVFMIKSDYSGWSDAANRIDIVQGRFEGGWKHIKTVISETGNGNNLFSGGTKQPLNLKLFFSRDVILLKLSLVSNPSKYVQILYDVEPEDLQGSIGLRSIGSDTCYDNLIVNEDYIPATLKKGVKLDGNGLNSYVKSIGGMNEKPVTIETWFRMESFGNGSRRQAIISNYVAGGLASQKAGSFGLYTNEYGTLYYTEKSSTGEFNNTLGFKIWTNEWIHLVLVRGNGVLKVYMNGELKNTINSAAIGETTSLTNPLTIGYCGVGGSTGINAMKGEIGDIRLWNTERTQAQIQTDMYRELTGTEEGLVQHWNFDSQAEGIVSNTVTGGLDCELLGHTQIGNQTIHRWDFSDATQLADFTTFTDGSANYVIQNGKLYTSGGGNSSWDVRAVVSQKYDNVKTVSGDMNGAGSSICWGGLILGAKDINGESAQWYDHVRIRMGGNRTSTARLPWGEIVSEQILNGGWRAIGTNACNTAFYPGATAADKAVTAHMKAEISGSTVTTVLSRADNPSIQVSQTLTLTEEQLQGNVGLLSGGCLLTFDNFTLVCEEPQTVEVTPEQPSVEETVRYDNQGATFTGSTKPWKMTKGLAETPYTVEAWVKIPEAVGGGYILSNAIRAPYISLQMLDDGKLRLSVAVENEELAAVGKSYDVDTDLRTGKWTHIAYTMDAAADQVIAYINGEAVATWDNAELPAFSFPDAIRPENLVTMGALAGGDPSINDHATWGRLVGWIADVRMWNKPLSADEIKDSMLTQYTLSREGLMVNLPLNAMQDNAYLDLSGNGYTVAEYSSKLVLEQQTHEPGSYSMIVVPDQQILSNFYAGKLSAMYQWIADNREKENIQIVMNVGDMADNCGNRDQWARTRAAVDLLPDDLPFITVPGNHDYDTNSGWDKGYGVREQLTLMNEYLPQSLFESYPTEIGFFDEVNSANHWQAFTVNGHPYLVLALEYVPQDDVITWANEVVEAHPDHQVIMITHSFVNSHGAVDRPYVWNDFLSKHENVIMSFSGHVWHGSVVHREDEGDNGNTVHNILMDAQFTDATAGGYAMLGILRFNADGTLCNVSYYSTDKDMYDANSNFTLSIAEPAEVTAKVADQVYKTVSEAVAAANGGVVEILKSTDEAITIEADVIIDLAGCNLSNVKVAEGYSLKLIDTAEGGSATVTGSVESIAQVDGKTYEAIGEDNVYTVKLYKAELYQQVSLSDDLVMNFVIEAAQDTVVYVTFNGETTEYDLSSMTVDENGKYTVSVDLAAAQMTEEIKLQLVSSDVVVLENSYSIRSYAEQILTGDYADSVKNLVKAMLHYGAKAQLYFDVNTDNLANAGYELEDVALPTEYAEMSADGIVSDLQFYGASLVFKNKIAVRFYFTGSVDGVSFGNYEPVAKDGMYYVEVADINPQDYANSILLTATKGDQTLTVSYSPLNYIIRMSGRDTTSAELKALVNALYGYHEAAVDYINRADEILANLLNADTRIQLSTINWTKVDDYTIHANGYNYALDNTATYADSEAIVKLSNASGKIGTAGLLLRANVTKSKGVKGYLFNFNTNANFIQIYHLNNIYNVDNSASTLTYVGGIVLNNYSISAENTEFYVKIEGSTLYVNTVARQQAGQNMLATVDLTKGGTLELYESGYTGIVSWVNGVNFDLQIKDFQALA